MGLGKGSSNIAKRVFPPTGHMLRIYLSCCVQNVQSYVFAIHVNMMSVCCLCGETRCLSAKQKSFLGRWVEQGADARFSDITKTIALLSL